jgi:GTP-binding nuclear protein Ran
MAQPIQKAFKCILLGDSECGKSTWVKRLIQGDFTFNYIPTLGVGVHPLTFATSNDPIRFNVWDTVGQERYSGLREGYYINADCAILMFDLTKHSTYEHLDQWYQGLIEVCGKMPIVVVGNKVDLEKQQILSEEITFAREHGLRYYYLSAKSNYHLEKPFLWLARELTHNPNLTFRQEVAIAPHEVTLP